MKKMKRSSPKRQRFASIQGKILFIVIELPLLIVLCSYLFINPSFPFIIPAKSNLSLGIAPILNSPYLSRRVLRYDPQKGDRVLIERNSESYIGYVADYDSLHGDMLIFTSLEHPFWVNKNNVKGLVYWPADSPADTQKMLSNLRYFEFERTKPVQYPDNSTQDRSYEVISYTPQTQKSSVLYGPKPDKEDITSSTIQLLKNKLFFVVNSTELMQVDMATKQAVTLFSVKDKKYSTLWLHPNLSSKKDTLFLSENVDGKDGTVYWLNDEGKIIKQISNLPYNLYSGYRIIDSLDDDHTILLRMGGDGCGGFGKLINKAADEMKELIKLGKGCDEDPRYISYDSTGQKALLYSVVPKTFDTTIVDSLFTIDVRTGQKDTIYDLKGWKENFVQFIPNRELHSVAMLTNDVFQVIDYNSKKITKVVSLNWNGISQRHRDIFSQNSLWMGNKLYSIATIEDSYRPVEIDTDTGVVSLIDIPAQHSSDSTVYYVYRLDKGDDNTILFWAEVYNPS